MKNIFKAINDRQFSMQSIIFWVVAISNGGSDKFWYFATAAIFLTGVQDILNELRKLNNKQNEDGKS